jgi:hypothetical protein
MQVSFTFLVCRFVTITRAVLNDELACCAFHGIMLLFATDGMDWSFYDS